MIKEPFILHASLKSSCFELIDWPLSRILLKNNASYPWLILVPRRVNITDISELCQKDRYQLIDEIDHANQVVKALFNPDKINIATLGNMVSQLHIHIIARFKNDLSWPHGVWSASLQENPYSIMPHALLNRLTAYLHDSKLLI